LPKTDYKLIEVETEEPIERINELTDREIEFLITELIEDEKNAKFNKNRRFVKTKRLEAELEKRGIKNGCQQH